MAGSSAQTLLDLGFVRLGQWTISNGGIAYQVHEADAAAHKIRLDQKNALYAFVYAEQVRYIGKTAQTLKKRFIGYCNPGSGQSTNLRCNDKIKTALKQMNSAIEIYAFNPISHLRYGDFEINIAAGLEDSLIEAFKPAWNKRGPKDKLISEDAEREIDDGEAVEADANSLTPSAIGETVTKSALGTFEIKLGDYYYETGVINVGPEASLQLEADGKPIEVLFDDGTEPVMSEINRRANANGSVRILGRNRRIGEWFRDHFQQGDVVTAEVLGPNRVRLLSDSSLSGHRRGEAMN